METFAEKCAYWRKHGAPSLKYGAHGREGFRDLTNNQFAQRELDMAAKDGRELIPVDKNGDRYY